jgi:acyl-CoA thioesterase-1
MIGLLTSMLLCAADPAPTLLVFGDSLSAGYGINVEKSWPVFLQQRLGAKWKVVNASQSGETTAGGLTRLPAALDAAKPKVVLLELGANDGLRGLDLARAEENLKQMVELAQAKGARVLLIGMRMPPNMGKKYVARFDAVFESVATSHHLPPPPFLLERIASDLSKFQSDQHHPIESAQPELLEAVWPALEPLLKEEGSGRSRR